MMELSKELDTAVRLAREAGTLIMKIYARPFAVDFKKADDPVTEADRQGNALLVQGLREAFPQDQVIGEEGGDDPSMPPANGRIWYVDPIDGTREFVSKNGEFCVMIGLAIGGHPRLGVVFRPTNDTLYAGITGQGAWVERGGKRESLPARRGRAGAIRLVCSRSHHAKDVDEMAKSLGITDRTILGSLGLKVCRIAEGDGDLYFDTSGASSFWDTCGPEAILRAAGGTLTDLHGRPVPYGRVELRNVDGVTASLGIDHADIVRRVAPVLAQHSKHRPPGA